jgi:hypothetical protein
MASLLDVWNAGTGVTSQALEMFTREKKYELDTKIFEMANDYSQLQDKLIADYTRPDENGNNDFQNEPEKYRDYVTKALSQWNEKALQFGNNSKYYNDRIRELELKGQEVLNRKYVEANLLTAKQNYLKSFAKRMELIDNDNVNYPTPESKFEARKRQIEIAANDNFFDPMERHNQEAANISNFWQQSTVYRDNGRDDTETAAERVAANIREADKTLKEKYGIDTKEYVQEKNIKTEAAKNAAVKIVQDRNYDDLALRDSVYDQNLRDIMNKAPGYERLIGPTIDMWIEGRMDVEEGLAGREYPEDKHPQMARFFQWDSRVLGDEPGKTISVSEAIESMSSELIQNVAYMEALRKGEIGTDVSGNEMQQGMTFGDIDLKLEKMRKLYGWDITPTRLRHEFTSRVIKDIRDNTNLAAGKEVISGILKLKESEYKDLEKSTGLSKDEIDEDIAIRMLNASAEYSRMEALAGNNERLKKEAAEYFFGQLNDIKQSYVGATLVLDQIEDQGEGRSSYKRGFGDQRGLARVISYLEEHSSAIQEDRYGNGLGLSMVNKETIRAALSEAGDLLNSFPDAAEVTRRGDEIIMTDTGGDKYKLTHKDKERVQLAVQDGDGWKPVAELYGRVDGEDLWVEVDANGKTKGQTMQSQGEERRVTMIYDAQEKQREAMDKWSRLNWKHASEQEIEAAKEELENARKRVSELQNLPSDYFRLVPYTGLGLGSKRK